MTGRASSRSTSSGTIEGPGVMSLGFRIRGVLTSVPAEKSLVLTSLVFQEEGGEVASAKVITPWEFFRGHVLDRSEQPAFHQADRPPRHRRRDRPQFQARQPDSRAEKSRSGIPSGTRLLAGE